MIGLHAIPTVLSGLNLTETQIMALGDGLIAGYDMRLRVDHRNRVTVQRLQWWGTAEDHHYATYYHNARERRTRLRRGQAALDNADLFIYYTPAARRQRGLP